MTQPYSQKTDASGMKNPILHFLTQQVKFFSYNFVQTAGVRMTTAMLYGTIFVLPWKGAEECFLKA